MKLHLISFLLVINSAVFGQVVTETFLSTRAINGHSVETLKKRYFEYRIEHRFGDLAGTNGGAQTGFGFDQAADIRFAFEYGITDKLMTGLGRNKGSSYGYRNVLDGFLKYKILEQTVDKMPISMTLIGATLYSYQKKSTDIQSVNNFPKIAHRFAYSTQLNIAHKLNQRLSLSVMPTYVHRNYVTNDDVNGVFAVGGAVNIKLTKTLGLLSEYYYTFNRSSMRTGTQNSLSFGFEWGTNGHNFHFNLSNASLFNEAQFIAFTTEKWSKGQFRIGFSISRTFKK